MTSSLAGQSYYPADPNTVSKFAYATVEPAYETGWKNVAIDLAIMYAGTSAKYSSAVLSKTMDLFSSYSSAIKDLTLDINYSFENMNKLTATSIADNLQNDFWAYAEIVRALGPVEAGSSTAAHFPLNISVFNTQMRPSGVIYGYQTVAAIYDIGVVGSEQYSASSSSDILYVEDTPTSIVDVGSGNDIVIFSKDYYSSFEAVRDGAGNDVYIFGGHDDKTSSPLSWLIYNVNANDYVVQKTASGISGDEYAIRHGVSANSEIDRAIGIDRIVFNDKVLAFDVEGNAGQAYRLYQAAFARTPDISGLSYWVEALDSNQGNLSWVAKNFMLSAEFKSKYGESVSDVTFLNLLYQNVLHRSADAGGLAYWEGRLHDGMNREAVLASFSESVENKANVKADIDPGIWLI